MNSLIRTIFLVAVFFSPMASLSARPHVMVGSTSDPDSSIIGRWDMTIQDGGQQHPSWLEVTRSGSKWLVGRYVGIVGSARPVSVIHYQDGKIRFSLPPQWEKENKNISFEGTLKNGKMAGTMVAANGKTYHWTAERAPLLLRDKKPVWGKPIKLFDGKDLSGWKALGENQWVVEDGVMKSPHSGSNLITKQKFEDFKLHIEFRFPPESNSGIYLRGRYEAQVVDSRGQQPQKDLIGAIYGFIVPSEMAGKGPGVWQSYDITLVGRMVTVVLNGKKIICNRPIPGITGGALNSNEGDPGPIYLQGDHGPVEYRNIVLTPAKK